MVIFGAMCAGFFTCNNSIGGTTLVIQIPNGIQYSTQIDSVAFPNLPSSDLRWKSYCISEKYNDGNFILKLKDELPESAKLEPYLNEIPRGIVVSDPNLKVFNDKYLVHIRAYKNGKWVGWICNQNMKSDGKDYIDMWLLYFDRECRISGKNLVKQTAYNANTGKIESTGTYFTTIINLSLKKGWNKVYIHENENSKEWTSTPPKGLEWKVQLL